MPNQEPYVLGIALTSCSAGLELFNHDDLGTTQDLRRCLCVTVADLLASPS